MKKFSISIINICGALLVCNPLHASPMSIEVFNANMEACYQSTLEASPSTKSPSITAKYCTRIIKEERTSRYNLAVALYNRALIYLSFNEAERAKQDLLKSLKLKYDNQYAQIALAQLYAKDKSWALALEAYKQADSLAPQHKSIKNNIETITAKLDTNLLAKHKNE